MGTAVFPSGNIPDPYDAEARSLQSRRGQGGHRLALQRLLDSFRRRVRRVRRRVRRRVLKLRTQQFLQNRHGFTRRIRGD